MIMIMIIIIIIPGLEGDSLSLSDGVTLKTLVHVSLMDVAACICDMTIFGYDMTICGCFMTI